MIYIFMCRNFVNIKRICMDRETKFLPLFCLFIKQQTLYSDHIGISLNTQKRPYFQNQRTNADVISYSSLKTPITGLSYEL